MVAQLLSATISVASNATPQQLNTNATRVVALKIKAKTTNTNPVYIGSSTSQDFVLSAGQEMNLADVMGPNGAPLIFDLSQIWCKVTTNGEGVTIAYAPLIP